MAVENSKRRYPRERQRKVLLCSPFVDVGFVMELLLVFWGDFPSFSIILDKN